MGVTLTKDGRAIEVPEEQVPGLVLAGYQPEAADARVARVAGEQADERAPGAGSALALGALRGLTFGGSDAVANILGDDRSTAELADIKHRHPIASTVGVIGGALATGNVGGLGAAAEGAGLGARLAHGAAEGIAQGIPQSVGAYVSDVALGDRELSGDGFVGAMKDGAMWGAAGGAAIGGIGEGLTYARKLFPKAALTKEAATIAENEAIHGVTAIRDDGQALADAARDQMKQIREVAAVDPATRAEMDAVAIKHATPEPIAGTAQEAVESAVATQAIESAPALEAASPEAPAPEAAPAAKKGRRTRKAMGTPPPADDLTAQLEATKAGLASGKTIGELSAPKDPRAIEDALNAHVAKTNPQMEKLVLAEGELREAGSAMDAWLDKYKGGAVAKSERKAAVDDWVSKVRPKESQYYSEVPKGEGTLGVPRGTQYKFRGSELDQSLAELDISSKYERGRTLAQKILEGDEAIGGANGVRGEGYFSGIKGRSEGESVPGIPGKPITAQDIIDTSNAQLADRGLPPLDAAIERSVRTKVNKHFVNADVNDAINAIGRYEKAHAEMVDALGSAAPPAATERAAAFREAEAQQTAKAGLQTESVTAQTNKATAMDTAKGIAGALGKVGEVTQLLNMMGVHVPDPRNIPVVGPILSLYLKARLGARVAGKFGWMIPKSTEAVIAGKGAAVIQRSFAAIDRMAANGAMIASKAAPAAGTLAAQLGHVLFVPAGGKPAAVNPQDLVAVYHARIAELAEASQPGAIREAVQAKIKASDPTIVDAIASTQERITAFLDSKAPKYGAPAGLLESEKAWTPSKSELATWGRYIQAANDPAAVLERASHGGFVSIEEVDTLKHCYPALFSAAQQRLLGKLTDNPIALPYARRVQLSILFDVPLDATMSPGYGALMQASYKAPPLAPPMNAPPGMPTIHSDITIGKSTANPLDVRGRI